MSALPIDISKLDKQLIAISGQKFSGKLNVQHQWNLYFIKGNLAWADGGHQWRRWWRLLYMHVPRARLFAFKLMSKGNTSSQHQGYEILSQWLEQNVLTSQEFISIISSHIGEVLFDLFWLERQNKLTFVTDNKTTLSNYSYSKNYTIDTKTALAHSQAAWQQWQDAKLVGIDPNLAPQIALNNRNETERFLQNNIPFQSFLDLKKVVNGEKTLRDIAFLLEKDLTAYTFWLKDFYKKGWIDLVKLTDVSPCTLPNSLIIDQELPLVTTDLFEPQKLLQECSTSSSQISGEKCEARLSTCIWQNVKHFKWMIPLMLFLGLVVGGNSLGWGNYTSKFLSFSLLEKPNLSSSQTQAATVAQIKISADTFAGYSTFRSQDFQESLRRNNIVVDYQDEFDQKKRAELLNQGQVDILATTAEQYLSRDYRGKIVGLIDYTNGGDALVLNLKSYPNLKSLRDLKLLAKQERSQGRQLSIAFAKDTPSEYLALLLSTKFEDFQLSDFNLIKVADASLAWKLLQSPRSKIAAAIIWEPYVTSAIKQGHSLILSSKDLKPGTILDVIVASSDAIAQRPEQVTSFLETYYRSVDAKLRTSQIAEQIAQDGKISSNDATNVLEGIHFFKANEAQQWFRDGSLKDRLAATMAILALNNKPIRSQENLKNLYEPKFIDAVVEKNEQYLTQLRTIDPDMAARLSAIDSSTTKGDRDRAPAQEIGQLKVRQQVQFESSSAALTPVGKDALKLLAKEISAFKPDTIAVDVIGHTSSVGDRERNQQLSQARAIAVANFLRQYGLKHRLKTQGKGSSQPLAGILPTDSRQQRTEIKLERLASN